MEEEKNVVNVVVSSQEELVGKTSEDNPREVNKCIAFLKRNALTLLTILGVFLGIALGFILRYGTQVTWTDRNVMYISFVGDIFLRMLKSLIIPLIVSSLITAISGMDLSLSGKIAGRAVSLYLTTTFCAAVLGIVLVVSIKPGASTTDVSTTDSDEVRNTTTVDTLLDLVRNMFPPNIVQACTQASRTTLTYVEEAESIYDHEISEEYTDTTNIIGLVVVSAVLGTVIAGLREEGKPLKDFFDCLFVATMKITRGIIWFTPVGVLFLVSAKILEIDDLSELAGQLGMYMVTVLAGILIQGFFVIPLLYFICLRKNPYRFLIRIAQALATAFGTASSSATMPITINCVENNCGVDSRIARFSIPIGAVLNMDGTALYEAVAALFIAQVRNVDLSIGQLIAVSITATAASIGAAGIPQAGMVTMVMVLQTVGLPAQDVTLIIAVDWLLNLAIGIGIQNFPEGLAVSLPLHAAGFSVWKSLWYGQLSGMVEPVFGVLGALTVSMAQPVLPYALAFAAGAMIYVVVDDIIPEANAQGNGKLASWSTIVGFLVMMVLDVGLG